MRVNTVRLPDNLTPQNDVGAYAISVNFAISATEADNGDRITLLEFQRDGYLRSGEISVNGTLGAAATIKLQHSNAADDTHTDLTAATTAAAADREQTTRGIRFAAGDTLSLLVGGGDIGAAATVTLDAVLSHNPVLKAPV